MKEMPALLIAVAFAYGCNREKNKLPDLPRGFSVEVNGAKWMGTSSRAITGYTQSCTFCPKDSIFYIEVYDSVYNKHMFIRIHNWHGTAGSYIYPSSNKKYSTVFTYVLNDTSVNNDQYFAILGNLTIVKLSAENVQGSFWAKMVNDNFARDTVIFTNGTFSLPLE